MNIDNYQRLAKETMAKSISERQDNIMSLYLAAGLCGEAGEVANDIKKIYRDGKTPEEVQAKVGDELGDVLWYLAMIANEFNLPLSVIAQGNLNKLAKRRKGGANVG